MQPWWAEVTFNIPWMHHLCLTSVLSLQFNFLWDVADSDSTSSIKKEPEFCTTQTQAQFRFVCETKAYHLSTVLWMKRFLMLCFRVKVNATPLEGLCIVSVSIDFNRIAHLIFIAGPSRWKAKGIDASTSERI